MKPNDASRIINVIDTRVRKLTGSEAGVETTWGEVVGVTADGRYASAYLYGETEYASEGFRIPGMLMVTVGDRVKVAWDKRGDRWITEVANLSAYKKVEIDPNAGTIKVGDGTARASILIADSSGVVVGVHDHDADYADIAHNHDADYAAASHAASHLSGGGDPIQGDLDLGAAGDLTAEKARFTGASDVTLAGTAHPFQIGPSSGENLAADANEIAARNNGATSPLHLNSDGGPVRIGQAAASGSANALEIGPGGRNLYDNGAALETDSTFWAAALRPQEADNARNGNSAISNYPVGLSYMSITSSTDAGWPETDGRGIVLTLYDGSAGGTQLWFQRPGQGNNAYRRNWNSNTSAWRAWVAL